MAEIHERLAEMFAAMPYMYEKCDATVYTWVQSTNNYVIVRREYDLIVVN